MVKAVEVRLKEVEAGVAREIGAEFSQIDDGGKAVGGAGEDAAFAVEDATARRGFEETTEALALGGGGVFFGAEELVMRERREEDEKRSRDEDTEQAEAVAEVAVGRG